ncbi:hypothetical protein N7448_008552 [Penicillium atrosanguineum]|uniref:uncharacterized protein n=1 Tax=Penicillium atrosanguineum TaxID=1132637 RepID=UPI00239A7B94|nr:uncharacterized protein N7443_000432 [Penicillium atrosanguineum]KAJ5127773.1 hypothetical protein N7448_008552 [Penicillium atrosanguineum]KAJ5313548.1 hypothetical protein N7443_000432 [Penicillium atrosanguineum]
MPSSRSSRPRSSVLVAYPPPPCVEEEPTSLARELHGLTKLGEKPGFEGTRVRGAVNQYPIILNTNFPGSSSSSSFYSPPPDASSVPGLGNVSSDDSSGPVTPPPMAQEPTIRTSSRPQSRERSRTMSSSASSASSRSQGQPSHMHYLSSRDAIPQRHSRPPPKSRDSICKSEVPAPLASSSSSNSRGRPLPALPRHSDPEVNVSRQPQPPPYSRDSRAIKHEVPVHTIPYGSRGVRPERPRSRSRGPVNERAHPSQSAPPISQSAPPISQSNTIRSGSTGDQRSLVHEHSRRESPPGYMSDSNAARNRAYFHHPPPAPPVPEKIPIEKPTSPTLAERIEEKLRKRQKRRDSGVSSDTETRSRAATVTIKPGESILKASMPASTPVPPSRDPQASGRPMAERAPASRPRAATVSSAPLPTLSRSMSKAGERPKSILVNGTQSGSSQLPRTPGSVKFQDQPKEKPITSQVQVQVQAPSRQTSPPQRPPNPTGLCITPCPRSVPTAGQTGWYTLKGLTHLDICPSCMGQIAHSRFRDFFIPSLAKPPTQKTHCAFANPWTRLSWTQMIKKKHDSLEMLYQMTRPPPGTRACPGRVITDQTWYRIVDPETNIYLPRFHVCGTCARNVRVLMPALRDTFEHCPEPQERACDFVTTSPRFVQFIDLLDDASSRAEADPSRRPDVRDFLNYARRKIVLRDCRRDRPTLGTWHYIPSLPELSVCEDCYDEVVWPLAKTHRPIARMFCTSMRLLPGDGPRSCREASCQLYSGRMRARFRDAVAKDDFAGLQSVSLRRYEAERRFKDRREELLVAEGKGYDCDEEMRKAVEEWRRWE